MGSGLPSLGPSCVPARARFDIEFGARPVRAEAVAPLHLQVVPVCPLSCG